MIRSILRPASRSLASGIALVALVGATACNQSQNAPQATGSTPAETAAPAEEPPTVQALPAGHIEVQHVLIGFQGSVPGKPITRSVDEAKTLAYQILDRAKKGESFDDLVKLNTDDQFPGIYRLADNGVTPDQAVGEYARSGMVKGFGDAAFPLAVGGVGIADYDKQTSPYGWHIVKRLR